MCVHSQEVTQDFLTPIQQFGFTGIDADFDKAIIRASYRKRIACSPGTHRFPISNVFAATFLVVRTVLDSGHNDVSGDITVIHGRLVLQIKLRCELDETSLA